MGVYCSEQEQCGGEADGACRAHEERQKTARAHRREVEEGWGSGIATAPDA